MKNGGPPRRAALRSLALATTLCLVLFPTARADSVLDAIGSEVASIFQKSKAAVVRVRADTENHARSGSGFFIDDSGRLLTTATVVGQGKQLWIEWQNHRLTVDLIGKDVRANLALLRVEPAKGRRPSFPFLRFGDSRALQIGSAVIAIGNPFDLPPSPSFGIVSGFDLHQSTRFFVTSHIRTDVALSPGESGSPLLNSRGEVIGILVASASQSPTSYALPSQAIQRLVSDFDQYGEARYGWIGMSVTECHTSDPEGALHGTCIKVQQVFSNTPAAKAGIQRDDEILRLGGVPVSRLSDMLDSTFAARVGQTVTVEIQRQTIRTNLPVEIVERPRSAAAMKSAATLQDE